jgi:hypothetical protein
VDGGRRPGPAPETAAATDSGAAGEGSKVVQEATGVPALVNILEPGSTGDSS